MRCPGQDWRYWKEDAVFEVPCPGCGAAVEIFKDETSGKCTKCGHRFKNPGIDFGCAEWCALAEQCLGVAPDRELLAGSGDGALAGRLIRAVKETFETDAERVGRALMVFQHAKTLVAAEGGDPRVVLAASLLLELGRDRPERPPETGTSGHDKTDGLNRVKQVLQEIGADEDSMGPVCEIIAACRTGDGPETVEFRIVHDADTLVGLAGADRQAVEGAIQRVLKTETARARAQNLLRD